MLFAKIYQPAKSAMQSGNAKTSNWVLEFEQKTPKMIDDLMGWYGSRDTFEQIRMIFTNKTEAVEFAIKNKISYQILEKRKPTITMSKHG